MHACALMLQHMLGWSTILVSVSVVAISADFHTGFSLPDRAVYIDAYELPLSGWQH